MILAEWSIPERRRGLEILVPIPHEIWLEIFDYLRPCEDISRAESKYALSNLTLVCRYYCVVCQPILFSDIIFAGNSGDEVISQKDHSQWCRHIMENVDQPDSLGSFVKSYSLSDWVSSSEEYEWVFAAYLTQHLETLPRFSRLQELSLSKIAIEVPLIKTIQVLSGLESLSFEYCSFLPPVGDLAFDGSMRGLKRFKFIQTMSTMEDDFLSYLPSIMRLVVTESLRVFETDNLDCSSALFNISDHLQVEKVSIVLRHEEAQLLSDLLNRTASIVDLSIRRVTKDLGPNPTTPKLHIHASSLPNLRSVWCASYFLSELIPNRPIRRVFFDNTSINVEKFVVEDIQIFKKSTVPVEDLGIYASVYKVISIGSNFPNLQSLTIFDDRGSTLYLNNEVLAVRHFISHCSRLGEFPPCQLNLPKQREALDAIKVALPRATHIRATGGFIEWRRCDDQSANWKPVVISRDKARSALLRDYTSSYRNYYDIVDEAGCLAGLFLPHELTPNLRSLLNIDEADR